MAHMMTNNAVKPVAHIKLSSRAQSAKALRVKPAKGAKSFKCATVAGSFMEGTEQAPPDPILGVSDAFKASTSPDKLNLGVGAYRTEELQPYVLEVVKKAEAIMMEKAENKEYLPIDGLPAFKKCTAELLLGADSSIIAENKIATLQSLSGTGSLRIGAAYINAWLPGKTVYLSNPTWGNHKNIFADAGVEWKMYRYFDPETVGLDFAGMMEDIKGAPDGSIIVLHGCAHNPTGVDPTKEQWEEIASLCQEKGHLPFFDVAYQGFASGSLEEDAFAPRMFAEKGLEFLCSQSYSKNLGLYGERVGAINAVVNDAAVATRVASQMKRQARAMYSNPPVHGARIVSEVVGDEDMFNEWKAEMEMMSGRIKSVRGKLYDYLCEKMPEKDWSFVTRQIGMFSFTGLTPAQVENMTNKWEVYMTKDGRISLAGLSAAKAEYLADAIVDSIKNA
ncbi:L-asparaginase 1 [Cymbomonas tetramitiformis]|uniref:Aspartate aminotransferase n=1 Tax=Cymbomonas tetramitiformis TaxID=36881 RepID=A0AAE0CDB8_9CHLO|nr:L-asparaginase 1 [Cymbomonas tetramitiformis]